MKKSIPNVLTLLNLFCGTLAILLYGALIFQSQSLDLALKENLVPIRYISFLVGGCLIFDLLDGLTARILHVKSEIGTQLDSLADMVSFGVLPSLLMTHMLRDALGTVLSGRSEMHLFWGGTAGILIALFSALRLAKFNLDDNQTVHFKGLATPANTIFILALFWVKYLSKDSFLLEGLNNYYVLLTITILSSYLLISPIPMFSMKIKSLSWEDNKYRYIFLLGIIALVVMFQWLTAAPLVIIWYVLVSIMFRKKILYDEAQSS